MINYRSVPRSKDRQVHPRGGKISVAPDERKRLKDAREAKGWNQRDLADRIGVAPATISNLETGRHPQVNITVYADLHRALFGSAPAEARLDDVIKRIVDGATKLSAAEAKAVAELIETLAKQSQR